jgi:hypothetical protein
MDQLVRGAVAVPGLFFPARFRPEWLGPAGHAALLAVCLAGYAGRWRSDRGGFWPPFVFVALLLVFGLKLGVEPAGGFPRHAAGHDRRAGGPVGSLANYALRAPPPVFLDQPARSLSDLGVRQTPQAKPPQKEHGQQATTNLPTKICAHRTP